MPSHPRVLAAVLLAWSTLTVDAAHAQASDLAVKAAFLPRFARYVSWPPDAMPKGSAPFVLCTLGGDPFGGSLDQASRSQVIDGRRIAVRRIALSDGVEGCHIVYIHRSLAQPAGQLLAGASGRPVLTVTDAANGGKRGIIHFAVVGGRVRFFIDEAQARRRGLTVSSRLLALAVGVRQR